MGEKTLYNSSSHEGWTTFYDLDADDVSTIIYTNIILIEDDIATSKFIKHAIKRTINNPVRIRSFNSCEKACEYIYSLKQFHLPGPDVAIVDYMLTSSNDGIWMCDLLKKRFPETNVILISSFSYDQMKEVIDRSETKPVFIQKPFEIKTFKKIFFS